MELNALNTRLAALADNYGRVNRTGHEFAQVLFRSSAAALPAATAIQALSKALYGGTEAEHKGVEGLRDHLAKLQSEDRKIAVVQQNLQRRLKAMERGHDALDAQQMFLKFREKQLLSAENLTKAERNELKTIRRDIDDNVKKLDKQAARFSQDEDKLASNLALQAKARQEFRRTAESVLDVSNVMAGSSKILTGVVSATGLTMAVRSSNAFNKSLIETNSTLGERDKLWAGALSTQSKTGDSLENIAAITAGLRSQTELYRGDWQKAVEETSKFQQGLGASVEDAMELRNAARAMRLSFEDVGNTIVRVVDQTSLSVRDAIGIVKELKTVLLGFNIQTNGNRFEAVTKQVAALEDSMRMAGASEGGALRVLRQFSDMRQRGGQGLMFGSGGPDFLSDSKRTKEFTQNLAAYLKQFSGNAMIFSQVAESVGLAAEDAQALIRSTDTLGSSEKKLAESRKTIEDRFREQSAASGKVYSQLLNNLKALMLEGLSPVTAAVRHLNVWMEGLRDILMKVRSVMPDWVVAGVKVAVVGGALLAVGMAAVKAVSAILLVREALIAVAAINAVGGAAKMGGAIAGSAVEAAAGQTAVGGAAKMGGAILRRITGAVGGDAAVNGTSILTREIGDKSALRAGGSALLTAAKETGPALLTASKATVKLLEKSLSVLVEVPKLLWKLPAGIKLALSGSAQAGGAAAGTFLTGLVPKLMGFLLPFIPVVLPLVVAAVAALAVGFAYKWIKDKQNDQLQREMQAMRYQRSTLQERQSLADQAKEALNVKSGTAAARNILANLDTQKKSILDAWRAGVAPQDAKVMSKMVEETKRRVEVQKATIQREAQIAPVERRNEMYQGLKDLLAAVQQLEDAQREIAEKQKQINEANRREQRAADDRQAVQDSVSSIASKSIMSVRLSGAAL